MRLRFSALLAVTAVATVAILAGCGGAHLELDLELDAGSEYPAAAEQVCAEVSKRFAQAQGDTPRSFEQAEELMSALSEVARQGQGALEQITPPPERAKAYERYLASRAEVVILLEGGLAAAREQDGEAYQQARDDAAAGARERARLAKAAGLRECAAGELG